MKSTLLLLFILGCCALHAQEPRVKAITGATLVDVASGRLVEDAVIVIDGPRISGVGRRGAVTVPPNATVMDGRGKFVMPGLADMHNHLQSGSMRRQQDLRSNLRRMLAVGITTVFDPSVGLRDLAVLKAASSEDAAPFARFFSTGPAVTMKGAGVDAIKVQRDDASWMTKQTFPVMKLDVLAALVKEAHQQGLKVYTHAPMLKHAKDALRVGVDGLMHGIIDEPVDQEFIDLMKRNRAVYVPTMALFNDVADVAAWARRQAPNWDQAALQPPRLYESFTSPAGVRQFESMMSNTAFTRAHLPIQKANVKKVFDSGVPIVLGTDSGFFGVLLGVSTQIELELLVEAGLKPADALSAATINAARMIGLEKELGTIEAGKLADLVVLDADPLQDVRNVTRIYRTLKGGVVYEPVDTARPIQ